MFFCAGGRKAYITTPINPPEKLECSDLDQLNANEIAVEVDTESNENAEIAVVTGEVTIEPNEITIERNIGDVVNSMQCFAGFRRDCDNKRTCWYRHIGETVGDPIAKYAAKYNKSAPITSASKSATSFQCPHCIKVLKTVGGLKAHMTRKHKKQPSELNREPYKNDPPMKQK